MWAYISRAVRWRRFCLFFLMSHYFCARKIGREMAVWNMGLVGGLQQKYGIFSKKMRCFHAFALGLPRRANY
jgi:hypothetical protein